MEILNPFKIMSEKIVHLCWEADLRKFYIYNLTQSWYNFISGNSKMLPYHTFQQELKTQKPNHFLRIY